MKKRGIFHNAQQAYELWLRWWPDIKAHLLCGGGRLAITVAPVTRSTDQNSRLHAVLGDIAKQVEWSGARRDIDTWKRLMTAAWLRARGESVEFLPAIDGHGVDIVFRRTSTLTVAECGELMEYVEAWGSERGVEWSEPLAQDAGAVA
jgi:hypothetical protein